MNKIISIIAIVLIVAISTVAFAEVNEKKCLEDIVNKINAEINRLNKALDNILDKIEDTDIIESAIDYIKSAIYNLGKIADNIKRHAMEY